MSPPISNKPHIVRQYFPRVQGNAFFDRHAHSTQLRLLEQFYFRIGLLTLEDLQRKYGREPAEPALLFEAPPCQAFAPRGAILSDDNGPIAEIIPDLPDGVTEKDGKYFARCCICDRSYELFIDPGEFDQDMSYCGGSPPCCP